MKLNSVFYTVLFSLSFISQSNAQELKQSKSNLQFIRFKDTVQKQVFKTAAINSSQIVLSKYDGSVEGILAIHTPNRENDYFAVRYEIPSGVTAPYTLKKIRFYNNDSQTVWPKMLITRGNGNGKPNISDVIVEFNNLTGPELGFLTQQTQTEISNLDNIYFVLKLPPGISFSLPKKGSAIGADVSSAHQQGNMFSTNGTSFSELNNFNLAIELTIESSSPQIQADLSVSKSDAVDPVNVGDNVTYTVTVNNNGPDTAENVVLTDNLPNGVTFISANPNQGSCSESSGVVTCNLGNIGNGGNATVNLIVNTTTAGTITNNASVTSSTDDSNSNNNSTSEQTTVNSTDADLSISKIDAVDPVTIGDNVTYTVTVNNSGPQLSENVVVTDNLPNGVTFVSAIPSQGSCSESSGVVTCNLGNIGNGGNAIVTIIVNTTTTGTITNNASVASNTIDSNSNNNSTSEQTTVNELQADLSITKSDSVDPVQVGDNVTYTVTVNNNGADTAENVVVTDNLPNGVFFVSVNPSQGSCSESSGVVTCNLGNIENGGNATVTIIANTTTKGTITNNASVASNTNDPNSNNNSTSEQTTVNELQADLSITKSDSVDPVTVGDNITYTVTVNNNGPETAENVVMTDNLPNDVSFVSANPSQGSCSQAGGLVACNLGNIVNGGSANVTIIITSTVTGTMTNTASVASGTIDPDNSNNSASEQTTVNFPTADLSVTKSDAVDPVTVGDNVTYTVTVSNNGPDTAENVVLTDNLSNSVTFVSANPDQGNCSELNNVVTCDLGNINNGESVIATIVVNTNSAGSITNNASVTSNTDDINSNNNSTSEQTTVYTHEADLSITKSDAVDPVKVGENVTYTVTVSNNGPQTAESIILTDTLPTGVTFISATPDQGSCSESIGVVSCNLGNIDNASSVAVTVVVKTTTAGAITNNASVTSNTSDSNTINNSTSEQTTVNELLADLSISKIDAIDPITVGGHVTYTITVNNNGPDTAENVVVTDSLPTGVTFVSANSSQGSCSETNAIVTCNLENISNGGNVIMTIRVSTTTVETITNNASATSSTGDPNITNNSASEKTTVKAPEADLSIIKSEAFDPVTVGDNITYTVTVNNNGPNTAENVIMTDNLPNGVTFVSANASQGNCSESNAIVACNLGNISNGGNVIMTIIVNTTKAETITNNASVTSSTGDPNSNNNSTSEPTTVNALQADLSITKIDSVDPVTIGDNVNYTVTVTNNGPNTAEDVVMSDNLPSDVLFVLATSSQGSCSEINGIVTCNLNDIVNGGSVNIAIVVKSTVAKTITNNASVVSSNSDPNINNNNTSEQTVVNLPPGADLSVSKSDLVDPVTVGNNISYNIIVTNNGPAIAENVILTDNLPSGVAFVSAKPDQGSCSESNDVVTCNLGNINNSGGVNVTIIVSTSSTGLIINNASVTSSTTDSNANNNSTSEQTTVSEISQADLSVSKNDTIDPVTIGDNVTYIITVSNNGPATAQNVVLTDNLPNGVTFVSANPDQGSCSEANNVVNCNLGNIISGGSVLVTIVVKSTATGTITNNASVTSSTSDSNGNNNSTSEQTTVNSLTADLAITKSDAVDPVTTGDNVTYTVTVSNNGPDTAENVVLTDNLPNDVLFVSANPNQGICSESNGIVTCNLGNLVDNASVSVTIVVNAASSGTITNNASVTSSTSDSNNNNNATSEQTTVNPLTADLMITKSDAVDPVITGDNVAYTITVSNNGPQTAENVVLTDNLPGNVTFVSANPGQGSCSESNGIVICNLGDISNNENVPVTIVVTTTIADTIINNANVSSNTHDSNTHNNITFEQTVINPIPGADLVVSKIDNNDPVGIGNNITYTITVTNNGPDKAENVILTDNLPNNVTFVSAGSDQGSCSEANSVVTCDLGEIVNGSSAIVTVEVQTTTEGTVTNNASVTSSTTDPNSNNNNTMESTSVVVITLADVRIQKTENNDPVIIGDNITYTLTVTNNGPAVAENVVMTDTLPEEVVFLSLFTSQGSCTAANREVTCNLGSIALGKSTSTIITVKTLVSGTITNSATVSTSTIDPNENNNTVTEQTWVFSEPIADLTVTKIDVEDPVYEFENVTYKITVTNNGPSTAENVILTDNLPDSVSFITATSNQGDCTASNGEITCSLGDLAKDDVVTITIVGKTNVSGILVNNASVTTSTLDYDQSNNNTSEQTTVIAVPKADLNVTKINEVDPVTGGDEITYNISIINNGPDTAENVVLTDNLPDEFNFISVSGDQGSCIESNGQVTCDLGNIANSNTVLVTLVVKTTTSGIITNTAAVTSSTSDPILNNNSSTEQTTVISKANLRLIISEEKDPVTVGNNVTYIIRITNLGPSIAENIIVTDNLPGSVAFVSAIPTKGSCSETDGIVICELGNMSSGNTFKVTVKAKTSVIGTITNKVSVNSNSIDPDLSNNNKNIKTNVVDIPTADLSLSKSDVVDPVEVGDEIIYSIAVINNGPDGAQNVVLTDNLPNSVMFIIATSSQDNCSSANSVVTCNLGDLASKGTATMSVVVKTTKDGIITNIASVTSDTHDPDGNNNNISEQTTVNATIKADLNISKSDDVDPVEIGDNITYTITINNNGPDDAENVVLIDNLPSGVTFLTANPSQGSCSESSGNIQCNLETIANAGNATVVVVVKSSTNGTINNTASVNSSTSDPNRNNNVATEQTTINTILRADLILTKNDAVDPVEPGDNMTYQITVTNNGPDMAENVMMTDNLPDNISFTFATTTQGSCSVVNAVVTCDLQNIDNGNTVFVTLITRSSTEGKITNTASVTSSTEDPDTNNNVDQEETTVDIKQSVEFSSFTATSHRGYITLQWNTFMETNNLGFDIERSRNSTHFIKIGTVIGNGTTTNSRNYTFVDSTASMGIYYYRLKQLDIDGAFKYSDIIQVEISRPEGFILEQNYPNPFNPETSIKYQLPQAARVTLTIYNITGQEVRKLVNEEKLAGFHKVIWDATDKRGNHVPSGIYIYVLRAGEFMNVKKLTLMR